MAPESEWVGQWGEDWEEADDAPTYSSDGEVGSAMDYDPNAPDVGDEDLVNWASNMAFPMSSFAVHIAVQVSAVRIARRSRTHPGMVEETRMETVGVEVQVPCPVLPSHGQMRFRHKEFRILDTVTFNSDAYLTANIGSVLNIVMATLTPLTLGPLAKFEPPEKTPLFRQFAHSTLARSFVQVMRVMWTHLQQQQIAVHIDGALAALVELPQQPEEEARVGEAMRLLTPRMAAIAAPAQEWLAGKHPLLVSETPEEAAAARAGLSDARRVCAGSLVRGAGAALTIGVPEEDLRLAWNVFTVPYVPLLDTTTAAEAAAAATAKSLNEARERASTIKMLASGAPAEHLRPLKHRRDRRHRDQALVSEASQAVLPRAVAFPESALPLDRPVTGMPSAAHESPKPAGADRGFASVRWLQNQAGSMGDVALGRRPVGDWARAHNPPPAVHALANVPWLALSVYTTFITVLWLLSLVSSGEGLGLFDVVGVTALFFVGWHVVQYGILNM